METATAHIEKGKNYSKITEALKQLIPFIGLIAIVLFFYIISNGQVLASRNLVLIMNQAFTIMIGAVGASFVLSHGGLDFSMGSVLALSALGSVVVAQQTNIVLAFLTAILIGALCGFITGGIHVAVGIPSFVVSICMMYLCRGIVSTFTTGKVMSVPESMSFFNGTGIKLISLLIVILVGYVIFEYTSIGKSCKSIGGNETAAFQSGVNVNAYKVIAFMIGGAACGIAGYFNMIRAGSVMPLTGQSYESNVLIALVLGGMPLSGGAKSKIKSAVIGSMMVAVLGNGLVLWGINERLTQGIEGLIFLIAVALTCERQKGIMNS